MTPIVMTPTATMPWTTFVSAKLWPPPSRWRPNARDNCSAELSKAVKSMFSTTEFQPFKTCQIFIWKSYLCFICSFKYLSKIFAFYLKPKYLLLAIKFISINIATLPTGTLPLYIHHASAPFNSCRLYATLVFSICFMCLWMPCSTFIYSYVPYLPVCAIV